MKPCPACKTNTLREPEVHNALSRRGDYYVCSDCGTREALEDYARAMAMEAGLTEDEAERAVEDLLETE